MKFLHSFAVIQIALTSAQLVVCQRGQWIKAHPNGHDIRIWLYFCLIQFTGQLPSQLMVVYDTVKYHNGNYYYYYIIIMLNCILQNFQSVSPENFSLTADSLPFLVFPSERALKTMGYFFLFLQTSHARHGHFTGSILISLSMTSRQR